MTLSVPRLMLLREVAARGTIAAAADAVAYTPSAVSQQLTKLEAEIGAPLLERHGRGVALTELGRIAVEQANVLFLTLDRASAAIDAARGTTAGRIGIASFPSGLTELVAPAAQSLSETAPELRLAAWQMEDNASIAELRLGTVDLALLQAYSHLPQPKHNDLSTTALLDDPLMLAIPSTWDERSGATLATFHDVPWISEPAETPAGRALEHAARAADFTPDIRYRVEDFTVTRALVAEGLGVALIPQLASSKSTEGVRLIRIPRQNMVRRIYAATRHDEIQRPTVRATLDALQRVAASIEAAR
jgi:DNA-binding transcriptional LysR family regulator